jgi:hypothetical protein
MTAVVCKQKQPSVNYTRTTFPTYSVSTVIFAYWIELENFLCARATLRTRTELTRNTKIEIIFWGTRVQGEWRKLHNEELHDLYSSPRIIRIIKARRMRWAGHVARMGEKAVGGKVRGKEATKRTKM